MINTILEILFLNKILFFLNFLIFCIILYFKHSISNYLNIIDYPDRKRKLHLSPVCLIGGPILFFITIISYLYFYIEDFIGLKKLFSLVTLCSIFFVVGLIDDAKNLNPKNKTLILIICLIIILPINNDFLISELNFLYFNKSIILNQSSIFFSIFCIFSLYNCLNFSDGINGISISISIYWLLFLFLKNPSTIYIILIMTLIVLLILNLNNKLFLGNSGTSVLSLLLSIFIIYDYNVYKKIFCDEIFFLLIFPAIDMIRVIIQRLINNKKTYEPDNSHFHHYLHDFLFYFNLKNLTFIVYFTLTILPYFLFNLTENFLISLSVILLLYIFSIKYLTSYNDKKDKSK